MINHKMTVKSGNTLGKDKQGNERNVRKRISDRGQEEVEMLMENTEGHL